MKKTTLKTKLVLKKQTIKALVKAELEHAIAGADMDPTYKQGGCPLVGTLPKP